MQLIYQLKELANALLRPPAVGGIINQGDSLSFGSIKIKLDDLTLGLDAAIVSLLDQKGTILNQFQKVQNN